MALFKQYRARRQQLLGDEQKLLTVDLSWLFSAERSYLVDLLERLYKNAAPQDITSDEVITELHRWGLVPVAGAKDLAFQQDWVTPLHTSAADFREHFRDGYRMRVTPSPKVFELHYNGIAQEPPTVRLCMMKSVHPWGFRGDTLTGVRNFRWDRVESVVYATNPGELQDHRYDLFAVDGRVRMRLRGDKLWVF